MQDADHDLLAAVVDHVGPLMVLEPEGRIVRFNPAAERLTGRDAAEAVGRNLFDSGLIPSEQLAELRRALALTQSEGRRERALTWYETPDGRRLIGWHATAIAGDDGRVHHLVIEGLDLTEAHEARVEAENRAAELEDANEELTQFASIVSHDLREPLRVVSGVAELFESRYAGDLDESAERLLAALTRSTERMSALLDGLLAYSRVGRIEEWRAIDVGVLLAEVLEGLGEQLADSGGQVLAGDLPTVHGDWVQLAQLFQNLIANALKFRGEAAPRVEIRARREGDHWHFEVADNGIGIDPRNRERVFEMFQRLHTRDTYPGTGVGLAIVKKIVERHGGRIWVEPGAERGTVFHFTVAGGAGAP
ncbi:MAG TPA: ATP-binding protein [Solirubrobacteraceae bacterium]